VPVVDIHDETFVAVRAPALRARIVEAGLLGRWFPGLRTRVFMDRGDKGVRWSVSGELDGSLEVWLENVPRGTLVHWFVRADPPSMGEARRIRDRYVDTFNAGMFALKDSAEATPAGG
jgi:hypothetical protein